MYSCDCTFTIHVVSIRSTLRVGVKVDMSYIVKQINPIGKGTPFKKKAYGILSLLQIF